MSKTTPLVLAKCDAFFDAIAEIMLDLKVRWSDECDYEDISTYLTSLRSIADHIGVKLVRMTKSPFGVIFSVGPCFFHASVSGNTYKLSKFGSPRRPFSEIFPE